MKKIIFFNENLNNNETNKSLINLLNRLIRTYKITLVLETTEGSLKKELNKKIKIIKLNKSILKTFLFALKHKNKYDFSCTYSLTKEYANLTTLTSKNNAIYIQNNYRYIYKKTEYLNFFNNINIQKFKNIIFTSNESEKDFNKHYPGLKEKTLVINNIINTKEILKKSKEQLKLKKNKESVTFIHIGPLEEKDKKISRLLECFKILIMKNKHIKLWIIGNGTDYENYKNYIEQNNLTNNIIIFPKETNYYKYLKNSNYLILTSDYESFPVVFNEANLLGKIIFTTIKISDDYYNLKDGKGYIIPKETNLMAKNIQGIIKTNPQVIKLNYDKLNKERIEKIKELIEK